VSKEKHVFLTAGAKITGLDKKKISSSFLKKFWLLKEQMLQLSVILLKKTTFSLIQF
jgi:hypothetical protein